MFFKSQVKFLVWWILDFPGGTVLKNRLPTQEMQEMWVQFLGWKDPLDGNWWLAPIFLPGKFHEQRNLAGYGLWGLKESDTTENWAHLYP